MSLLIIHAFINFLLFVLGRKLICGDGLILLIFSFVPTVFFIWFGGGRQNSNHILFTGGWFIYR